MQSLFYLELQQILDDKGYLRCFVGFDRPCTNKGFVLVHRLCMENHLGRYLGPDEIVHHMDEIKINNDIDNLFLCSGEEHVQIHNRYRHNSLAKRGRISQGLFAAQKRKITELTNKLKGTA